MFSKQIDMLSTLTPLPLAFLAFYFSWAMQVLIGNVAVGLVPYALLLMSAAWVSAKKMYRKKSQYGIRGINSLDLFIGVFLLFSSCHALLAITFGGYSISDGLRFFLVYVVTAWVYFYISRYARESEIRMVMVVIAIATVIVSIEWVYEVYSKLILHAVVGFQQKAAEYQVMRRDIADVRADQLSLSSAFRSYGLFENYTVTGPMVALGAFATLTLFSDAGRGKQLRVLVFFLIVQLVGMATTSLVSYMIILPFVTGFLKPNWNIWKILKQSMVAIMFFLILITAILLMSRGNPITEFIVHNVTLQFDILTRLDESHGISWLGMYLDNLGWYADFIDKKMIAIFFGEGVLNYGYVTYDRGGDVGLLEFASAYGIPFVVLFLAVCFGALRRSARSMKHDGMSKKQKMYMLFSFSAIAFCMLSLLHYDILFVKSVLVMFYLALGLVRRYGYARPVKIDQLRIAVAGKHLGDVEEYPAYQ